MRGGFYECSNDLYPYAEGDARDDPLVCGEAGFKISSIQRDQAFDMPRAASFVIVRKREAF